LRFRAQHFRIFIYPSRQGWAECGLWAGSRRKDGSEPRAGCFARAVGVAGPCRSGSPRRDAARGSSCDTSGGLRFPWRRAIIP